MPFISIRCRRRRPELGDWGRVKSVGKDRKRLRVTKRKTAEAADSKSRHYVSAQQRTFDQQLFFFRLAGKFLLFMPNIAARF